MVEFDMLDIIVLVVIFLGMVVYFIKGKFWGVVKDFYVSFFVVVSGVKVGKIRNIFEKMEEFGKNCIIFYGL